MATRNIVPRADGEGSIGTAVKHWGAGHFEKLVADDVVAKGPVVDVRAFGAKGDGVTDDTAAIQAALDSGGKVYFPDGDYLTSGVNVSINGTEIDGEGSIVAANNTTSIINVNANNVKVSNLKINANGATYGISINDYNCLITKCYFSGNVGHYITTSSDFTKIINNTFDMRDSTSVVTPVVFTDSSYFECVGNTFFNNIGFGIQTRWSNNGVIAHNVFDNPLYTSDVTVASSSQTLTFVLDKECQRFGLVKDNLPITFSITKIADFTYQVTLSSAASAGAVYTLYGARSLECININSESHDISISENIINGSGDSGIVTGADYHNRTLAPSSVTVEDFPYRITVDNNIIDNILYAGIANTHPTNDSIYTRNIIKNVGLGAQESVYRCGIKIDASNAVINENTIDNKKIRLYGCVFFTKTSLGNAITIKSNIFNGLYGTKIATNAAFVANAGVILDTPVENIPMPDISSEWANYPKLDNWWSAGASGGTGFLRTTIDNQVTLVTLRNQVVQMSLKNSARYKGQVVFSFWAKAEDSSATDVSLYTTIESTLTKQTSVKVTNTNWTKYTLSMFLWSAANGIVLDFRDATGNGIFIQDWALTVQNIS
jgi:hypothetical protein